MKREPRWKRLHTRRFNKRLTGTNCCWCKFQTNVNINRDQVSISLNFLFAILVVKHSCNTGLRYSKQSRKEISRDFESAAKASHCFGLHFKCLSLFWLALHFRSGSLQIFPKVSLLFTRTHQIVQTPTIGCYPFESIDLIMNHLGCTWL